MCPPCPVCPPVAVAPVAVAPTELFVSPKDKRYRITWAEQESYEFDKNRARAVDAAPPGRDDFDGEHRAAAKTSIATGPHKPYQSLHQLLDELEEKWPDEKMRNRNPPISMAEDSNRVSEENRNVTVPAWLYAVKKEKDNDYHLIIGTNPNQEPIRYFNVEISGLPEAGSAREQLRTPRNAFQSFLRDRGNSLNPKSYLRFEDPVEVIVTGSLFYDIDHKPGVVGSFKEPRRVPDTAWEIHPVTEIVLEP